jgi:hypothetical protein
VGSLDARKVGDLMQEFERKSDVDGFTVIFRPHRSPKVHLLRSWDECNVELARKRGSEVQSVPGSREALLGVIEARKVAWCKRCFPQPKDLEAPVLVEEYAEEEA